MLSCLQVEEMDGIRKGVVRLPEDSLHEGKLHNSSVCLSRTLSRATSSMRTSMDSREKGAVEPRCTCRCALGQVGEMSMERIWDVTWYLGALGTAGLIGSTSLKCCPSGPAYHCPQGCPPTLSDLSIFQEKPEI